MTKKEKETRVNRLCRAALDGQTIDVMDLTKVSVQARLLVSTGASDDYITASLARLVAKLAAKLRIVK